MYSTLVQFNQFLQSIFQIKTKHDFKLIANGCSKIAAKMINNSTLVDSVCFDSPC